MYIDLDNYVYESRSIGQRTLFNSCEGHNGALRQSASPSVRLVNAGRAECRSSLLA